MQTAERIIVGHEFEFVAFAVILFLIGLLRQFEFAKATLFLRAFVNSNLVDQQIRQERSFGRLAMYVFVVSIAVLAAFATVALQAKGYFLDLHFAGLMTIVLIGIVLLTTIRVAGYSLLAWVFDMDALQQVHTFYWLLTNFIQALILLPLSILAVFGPALWQPWLLTTGLWVLVISYISRVFRLYYIGSSAFRVPLMYNFLYLCALEILPVVVMITVISREIAA